MSNFKGRVAIVTGAASGIGKQVALRLAAEGAIPVIADLNLDAASATAKEIQAKGTDAFAVAMNVVDEAQVEKGVADTEPGSERQAAIVARLLAHGANANVELGFAAPLASVVQGTRDFLRPGSDHLAVAELLVAAGNPVEPRFLDTADGPLVAWLEERLVG